MSTPKKKITKNQMKSIKAGQSIKARNQADSKKPTLVSTHSQIG